MRQIAKWTFLCILCTACGFGATYLLAHSDRMMQTLVAMLPVPSQSTGEDLAAEKDLAAVAPEEVAVQEQNRIDAASVDLAAEVAAADLPVLSGETTVGTFATGQGQLGADPAQTGPSTGPLNAVGVVTLVRDRQVVLGASGRVDEVNIEVGDVVSAGDLLIALDTTYLDWAVEQAEIAFETARIDFEEAGKAIDEADIAVAEANLLLAQENLAEVERGPTPEQLAAAESAAAAAWASLEELQAGPRPSELVILQAQLRRAEIAVQAAQREYDKIAWLPEAAATEAADELQNATIGLEEAQASFEEATLPPTQAEIESATSAAQSAQDALNQLQLQPTPADLASAQAAVAEAEAALEEVQKGPEAAAVRKAELGVRDAMIALEDARLAQSAAQVLSPIDGTVLAVDVDLGQQASAGDVVATLADTTELKLTVNVEQRDISRVSIGQQVAIAVYALANDQFTGVVEQIAPVADAGTGFVTFPVIIQFTEGPVEKLLPGMTASATFADSEVEAPAQTPTTEAAEEATPEATVEPEEEATAEATEEATVEATEEASEESADEATPEVTEEPTEEPAAEATATPSN